MKPRQPVFFKVPNPANESKDEGRQESFSTLSVRTERFFIACSQKKGEIYHGKTSVYFRIRY